MSIIKNKLKQQAEHDSVLSALIAVLVFLTCIFCPLPFKNEDNLLIASFSIRLIFSVVAIALSLAYGLYDSLKLKKLSFLGVLVLIASLLLAISNFPVFELAKGQAHLVADGKRIALYALYCISVAMFEELFFRGLVLPLLMTKFKDRKGGGVLAVLASSAVFGAVHIFNIFAGASVGGTLLQVGYTFLVGLLCGSLFLITKSVIYPIIIHLIYNAGGLLLSQTIIIGKIWTPPSIIFMSIASLTATITCILAIKNQNPKPKKEAR